MTAQFKFLSLCVAQKKSVLVKRLHSLFDNKPGGRSTVDKQQQQHAKL